MSRNPDLRPQVRKPTNINQAVLTLVAATQRYAPAPPPQAGGGEAERAAIRYRQHAKCRLQGMMRPSDAPLHGRSQRPPPSHQALHLFLHLGGERHGQVRRVCVTVYYDDVSEVIRLGIPVKRSERPSRFADVVIIGSGDGHDDSARRISVSFPLDETTSRCTRRRVAGLCMLGTPSPTCWGALIEAATIRHRACLATASPFGICQNTDPRPDSWLAALQMFQSTGCCGWRQNFHGLTRQPLNAGATSFMKRSISSFT